MTKLLMDFQPPFMAGLSLRKIDRSHWSNKVQLQVVAAKRPQCSVCGFIAEQKRSLIHADEVWEFLDPSKVVLKDVRPLCVNCHEAKDYTDLLRRILNGKASASRAVTVVDHYCTINSCDRKSFDQDFSIAREKLRQLEVKFHWGVNLNISVDYGQWARSKDKPQLSVTEKKFLKYAFSRLDNSIVCGDHILTAYSSSIRILQSLSISERQPILDHIRDYLDDLYDGSEILAECDEGVQFE